MLFAWDERKRESNLLKHKLDLVRGAELFDGRPVVSYPSPRGDEARVITIGFLGDVAVAVIWTKREDTIRLISYGEREMERKGPWCALRPMRYVT